MKGLAVVFLSILAHSFSFDIDCDGKRLDGRLVKPLSDDDDLATI